MSQESALLASLIDGARRQRDIPIPKETRFRIARRLEASELLLRNKTGWQLTSAGLRYAIAKHGIMPTAKPYALPTDDKDWQDHLADLLETNTIKKQSHLLRQVVKMVLATIGTSTLAYLAYLEGLHAWI